MSNPFPSSPIPPVAFHGRARELSWLLQRVAGPGVVRIAVSSDARLGLSSLLRKVESVVAGNGDPRALVATVDLDALPADAGPSEFWASAFAPLAGLDGLPTERTAEAARGLLEALAARGQRLVLLIDHLDGLARRPGLLHPDLVALLADDGPASLAVVAGLGHDPLDLDASLAGLIGGRRWLGAWRLLAIDGWAPLDVRTLLNRAETLFDREDHAFLSELAGGHPLLLHLASSLLWEARTDVLPSKTVDVRSRADVRVAAAEAIRTAVVPVTGDLLSRLMPPDRAALLYLGLADVGLHVAAPVPRSRATAVETSTLLLPAITELVASLSQDELSRLATQIAGPTWAATLPWAEPERLAGSFSSSVVRAALQRPLLEAMWGLFPDRQRQVRATAALCGIPLRADPVRPPDHNALLRRGLVANPKPGVWTLRAGLVRWWVADELARIASGETTLADWLAAQDIEDLWTPAALAAADEDIAYQAARFKRGASLLALGAARHPKL